MGVTVRPRFRGTFRSGLPVAGAVIAMAGALLVPLTATAVDAQAPDLPDLISVPPTRVQDPEQVTWRGETDLVIRFDGHVTNVGSGPLDLYGNPSSGTVAQRARSGDTWVDVANPEVVYQTADGHNHWHLMKVARYSLWNEARTAEVAPGQKVGFCLYDVSSVPGAPVVDPMFYTGPVVRFCEVGNPDATQLRMGISAGYQDVYDKSLTYQWVEVSDVSPGVYWVAAQIDPDNVVVEENENNNTIAFSNAPVTVPGYVATPVGPIEVLSVPVDIELGAATFGSPGARGFRIVDPPDHGSLDVAVGSVFAGPAVRYTPDPGYVGSDSFTYAAVDQASQYPRNPVAAAVAIDVGPNPDVSVVISGAPSSMHADTSVALTATVTNAGPDVVWSVAGVVGGTTTAGTITQAGLYRAPAVPPPGGSATIRATSAEFPSAYGEVTIIIDPGARAPVVTRPQDQVNAVGDPVSLPVVASDPDGDSIVFSAAGLPPGLAMDAGSGTISGTPTTPGTYLTTVFASDGDLVGSAIFTWTVEPAPPGIAEISDVTLDEGTSLVVSVDVSDPQGLPYICSLVGPDYVSKASGDDILLSPGYDDAGSAPVTVIVTNDAGLSAAATFTVTVSNVNRPPVVGALADVTTPAGTTVDLAVVARDPDGDALSYTASGLPAGIEIDAVTGAVSGVVGFGDQGAHAVALTVSDGESARTIEMRWTVTDAAPTAGIAYRVVGRGANAIIELSGRASADPEGGVLRYYWDLDGDGSFDDARRWWARLVTVPGEHDIGLRVVDASGNPAETTVRVAVP